MIPTTKDTTTHKVAATTTRQSSSKCGQVPFASEAAGISRLVHQPQGFWAGSAANVYDFNLDLDAFVRNDLPLLNRNIEIGTANVADLMTATRGLVLSVRPTLPHLLANADRQLATEITRRLGFIAASIERHAQGFKARPGDGILSVSGFTELLCAWAEVADISPMLDYDNYWIKNRHAPLTFTGEREEVVFNELVNRTVDVVAGIMRPLNDLRMGVTSLGDTGTTTELNIHALKLVALYEAYRDLLRKSEAGAVIFSPEFFMRMRQYLLSFPIAGTVREGPNATYSPNQARIDVALGFTTPTYLDTLATRQMNMTPAHRDLMASEMRMPSIADRIVAILDLPSNWSMMKPAEILQRAQGCGLVTVQTITALKQISLAQIQLSNVHFGRIATHLTKPSAKLSPAQADAMPVKPSGGVGGNDITHTREIVDMRKSHPVITVLFADF